MPQPPIPRRARAAALVAMGASVLLATAPAAACELDGLSHGYGPMSALFAGAHRYSSLNGVEEEVRDEAPPPPPSAAPPSPRRSFVAWARVQPKPAGVVAETPAPWAAADQPRTAPAETAAPGAPRASSSPKP